MGTSRRSPLIVDEGWGFLYRFQSFQRQEVSQGSWWVSAGAEQSTEPGVAKLCGGATGSFGVPVLGKQGD